MQTQIPIRLQCKVVRCHHHRHTIDLKRCQTKDMHHEEEIEIIFMDLMEITDQIPIQADTEAMAKEIMGDLLRVCVHRCVVAVVRLTKEDLVTVVVTLVWSVAELASSAIAIVCNIRRCCTTTNEDTGLAVQTTIVDEVITIKIMGTKIGRSKTITGTSQWNKVIGEILRICRPEEKIL